MAVVGSLASVAGCAGYEYVVPDCGPAVSDPGHSRIAWQHAGPPGQISGRIVELPNGTPVREGQARVQGRGFLIADTSGYVHIENVRVGAETLVVRVFGHSMASELLDLRPDSGIVFVAVMEPRPMMFDGCGSVLVQRRKPWWKVW